MRVGIHPVSLKYPGGDDSIGPTLAKMATVAEEGGVSYFAMMDHYFMLQGMGDVHDPAIEGYTTSGYLVGITKKMQIGLLVTGVTYRHPGLLAKIVTTLDVLSGGRAILGIGAAWYEREHLGLGVPFPSLAERFERLEEAVRICLQMWSDDDGPFEGRHYRLAETICSPRPLQQPHPPIMIGGGGERKTLRLVAQYADACNLFAADKDEVQRKLDVLRRHCDTLNRDYGSIEKTIMVLGNPLEDIDTLLQDMERYAAMGVGMAVFIPSGDQLAFVERVARDVVPRLQSM